MSWLSKLFLGVDLDEEQQRANEQDAALAQLNRDALANGTYDQKTFDQAEANRLRGATPDIGGDVAHSFWQGFQEGAAKEKRFLGSAISFPFVKLIPWQLYLIGAIALFFYLGGAVYLKGILARR